MVKLGFGLAILLVRLWLRHAPRPETSWKFLLGYKFVASTELTLEVSVTKVYVVNLARTHECVCLVLTTFVVVFDRLELSNTRTGLKKVSSTL